MTERLSQEALEAWDANAAYWDDGIGADGNQYWHRLQEPSLRRLLSGHLQDARALDLCTGNGICARWMARLGARDVLATDGSQAMLERARRRTGADGHDRFDSITFRLLDVTDNDRFVDAYVHAGGPERYDVILMNMAIMDVASLEALASHIPRLLTKNGVFVATVLHPVFFTSNYSRNIELKFDQATGELDVIRTKVIQDYLFVPPVKGIAIPGQPVKQLYFHRPIHELLSVFFGAGLVLDALEEPAFTEADAQPARIESSRNYTQLPAILSFRMRRST